MLLLLRTLYIEWVIPICLPFGESLNLNLTNQTGEVAGWGLTSSDDEAGTPFLQTVKVLMYNMQRQFILKVKNHL